MRFNNFYYIFCFFSCCLFPLVLQATSEPGSIRGNAINKNSGNSISNAKITLIQNGEIVKTVTTNDDGTFILPEVYAGVYDLSCEFTGFINQKIVGLEIRSNHTKLAFFKLSYGDTKVSGEDIVMTYASLQVLRERSTAASSKTESNFADLPATIYVFTQEDIRERGYMHISELLQDVPQLEVNERSSSANYNIISSRGITGNEKLLILVNGVRVTSMTLTSHALDKAFAIRHAAKVEVIIGPSSSAYESDAFVGVVNIIMPDGRKKIGGALSSSYGMYHTTENAIMAAFGKGRIGASIQGSFYNSQDPNLASIYTSDYKWFNEVYSQSGGMLNSFLNADTIYLPIEAYATPQQAYSIQAQVKIYDFEIGMSHHRHNYSAATALQSKYTSLAAQNMTGMSNNNLYAKYLAKSKQNASSPTKWNLESLFNWNNYSMNSLSTTQNLFTKYRKAFRINRDNNIRIRETFNLTYKPNERQQHNFLAGGYFRFSLATPKTNYMAKPFERDLTPEEQDMFFLGSNVEDNDGNSLKLYQKLYQTQQLNGGAFLQYSFKFKDLLSISIGGKIDYLDVSTPSAVIRHSSYLNITPRVSFVVRPYKFLRLKLFYAEAALAPPLNRQFENYGSLYLNNNSLEGELWKVTNDSLLVPEQVRSTEFEASFSKDNLLIIANGYFSYGQNLIRERLLPNQQYSLNNNTPVNYALITQNSAEAFLYGASIFASYKLTRGNKDQFTLKVDASYSYADGQTSQLEYIPFTAKHTVKAGIILRYKFLSLSTRLIYRSASYNEGYVDNNSNFLQFSNQDFVVLNLFAKGTLYENKKSGLGVDLFAKVYNLTNAQYYHTTDNNPLSMGAAPQAPITVLGGFNFRFLR